MHSEAASLDIAPPPPSPSVRQLTAIMFTDMVGYTALMQEDERRARASRDRQRSVLGEAIERHGGRILELHGDGTLSVFPSAIEAVRAAIEIQGKLVEPPRVPLRIGLHTGDVIHDREGVLGDGVNVAARVQALSVPGGVLISEKVYDEVKNQSDIETRSLGRFDLKNVKRPVEVFAVLSPHLAVPTEGDLASSRFREPKSVAVLPFTNMSSDPENEFFSDGMTEEIINALVRVDGLLVTARTSSFAFKNKLADVREIGRQLGVGTVLEGSVRRMGSRVRIAAQLIDVRDGYHIFSEVYDRTLDDIFETQDDIARTIVSRLERHFAPGAGPDGRSATAALTAAKSGPRLVRGHTHDTEAYTEYLRGRYHFWRWSPQSAHKAIAHFERAVSMDPDCALPWSGLASAWTFLGALGQLPPHEAFPRAEEAALRALELEETAGESHLALASVQLFYLWDFDAARRSFRRALSLTPGSAEAHHHYALYLRVVGEAEEAIEETETALELDPLSLAFNHSLGVAYFAAGRVQEARAQLERTLEMDPGFRAALETLGWLHAQAGEMEEALRAFERMVAVSGNRYSAVAPRGFVYGRMGRTEEARAMLALLEERAREFPEVLTPVDAAYIHKGIGDLDAVFDLLHRAVDERIGGVVFIPSSPLWRDVRSDPRWEALAARIGVPVRDPGAARSAG